MGRHQWVNRWLALKHWIRERGCSEFSNFAVVIMRYVFWCDLEILKDIIGR